MAFKFVLLFASLAAVKAGVLQPAGVYQHTTAIFPQQGATIVKQPAYVAQAYQPTIVKQVQPAYIKKVEYAEAPANYEFSYDVHDTHTGDIKQQNEKAVNGAITGQYSLIDADGHRRIVDYTADDHHGFNANVRREPLEGHKIIKTVQPAIAVQKIIAPAPQYYSAPAQQHYSAPSYYHH